jgi:pyruvate dehydrogenase E2 component (dihydrolipoamide acetyltransferase)
MTAAEAGGATGSFSFTADGRSIYCATEGSGDEAFVLVPGYAADHTGWMLTRPALATRGRVFSPDLPGGLLSSLDVGPGDIAFFAGIVRALMDNAGLARAHLVGHSMGAAIAVAVATAVPERVSRLTLIAPAGIERWINMPFISGFPQIATEAEARPLMEMLVANPRMISPEMLRLVVAYTTTPGIRQALETIAAATFPGEQVYLYRDRLAALGMPVRVIWGADDRIVNPIAEGFPEGMPVTVIPRAGHLVHLEQAPAVNALILA